MDFDNIFDEDLDINLLSNDNFENDNFIGIDGLLPDIVDNEDLATYELSSHQSNLQHQTRESKRKKLSSFSSAGSFNLADIFSPLDGTSQRNSLKNDQFVSISHDAKNNNNDNDDNNNNNNNCHEDDLFLLDCATNSNGTTTPTQNSAPSFYGESLSHSQSQSPQFDHTDSNGSFGGGDSGVSICAANAAPDLLNVLRQQQQQQQPVKLTQLHQQHSSELAGSTLIRTNTQIGIHQTHQHHHSLHTTAPPQPPAVTAAATTVVPVKRSRKTCPYQTDDRVIKHETLHPQQQMQQQHIVCRINSAATNAAGNNVGTAAVMTAASASNHPRILKLRPTGGGGVAQPAGLLPANKIISICPAAPSSVCASASASASACNPSGGSAAAPASITIISSGSVSACSSAKQSTSQVIRKLASNQQHANSNVIVIANNNNNNNNNNSNYASATVKPQKSDIFSNSLALKDNVFLQEFDDDKTAEAEQANSKLHFPVLSAQPQSSMSDKMHDFQAARSKARDVDFDEFEAADDDEFGDDDYLDDLEVLDGNDELFRSKNFSKSSMSTFNGSTSGHASNTTHLFQTPIPHSGMLLLSEEEKRTLLSEGYPIPTRLPLTKQEERNLKKIRRKIKNKISAQESRRKKKEYLEAMEKKVEIYSHENNDLRRRLDSLENSNRSLLSQLRQLQHIMHKSNSSNNSTSVVSSSTISFSSSPKNNSANSSSSSSNSNNANCNSAAALFSSPSGPGKSTCLMVFMLFFAVLFVGGPQLQPLHSSTMSSSSSSASIGASSFSPFSSSASFPAHSLSLSLWSHASPPHHSPSFFLGSPAASLHRIGYRRAVAPPTPHPTETADETSFSSAAAESLHKRVFSKWLSRMMMSESNTAGGAAIPLAKEEAGHHNHPHQQRQEEQQRGDDVTPCSDRAGKLPAALPPSASFTSLAAASEFAASIFYAHTHTHSNTHTHTRATPPKSRLLGGEEEGTPAEVVEEEEALGEEEAMLTKTTKEESSRDDKLCPTAVWQRRLFKLGSTKLSAALLHISPQITSPIVPLPPSSHSSSVATSHSSSVASSASPSPSDAVIAASDGSQLVGEAEERTRESLHFEFLWNLFHSDQQEHSHHPPHHHHHHLANQVETAIISPPLNSSKSHSVSFSAPPNNWTGNFSRNASHSALPPPPPPPHITPILLHSLHPPRKYASLCATASPHQFI